MGRECVRDHEDLGRRSVILLETDESRVRVPRREPEQVRGRCADEREDRLVVVADHADLVAIAEPSIQQGLLQRVDVLVLVDRERREP